MNVALWRKHWRELRSRWFFMVAFAVVPAIFLVLASPAHPQSNYALFRTFFLMFAFFVLGVLPARSAGTGIKTFADLHPQKGADPSMLFMLSLPVRRRTLFLLRSVSGILAMISAGCVGLAIDALLFLHSGSPLHWFLSALWLLPILLPLYFLDSLLSIRLSEATVMQAQVICSVLLFIAYVSANRWTGAAFASKIIANADPHFTMLLAALAACVVSTAFAALTVRTLDRQNF